MIKSATVEGKVVPVKFRQSSQERNHAVLIEMSRLRFYQKGRMEHSTGA